MTILKSALGNFEIGNILGHNCTTLFLQSFIFSVFQVTFGENHWLGVGNFFEKVSARFWTDLVGALPVQVSVVSRQSFHLRHPLGTKPVVTNVQKTLAHKNGGA